MSNLGAIYEFDFKNYIKNKYPVIYRNNTYTYYKRHGSDRLEYSSNITLLNYNEFKEKYLAKLIDFSCHIKFCIYVGKNIEPDFSFIKEFSHEECALRSNKTKELIMIKNINGFKQDIARSMSALEIAKENIKYYEQNIKEYQLELEKREKELFEFQNKENMIND